MRLSDEKSLLEQMTIEQARQNIALLKVEEIEMPKKWVLELLNTIEALQQENERLADETIKLMKENAKNSNKKDEMVKVLKQARESLQAAWEDDGSTTVGKQMLEIIKAIDALIGGKEDE